MHENFIHIRPVELSIIVVLMASSGEKWGHKVVAAILYKRLVKVGPHFQAVYIIYEVGTGYKY
jgi:hypothetical protein